VRDDLVEDSGAGSFGAPGAEESRPGDAEELSSALGKRSPVFWGFPVLVLMIEI
jgi:hypothetical protein